MKKLKSLRDLMIDELKDLQNAEKQIIAALPKMVKKASNQELKNAFSEHLEQTREHVNRLEQVFEICEQKFSGKTCRAMQGIIEEVKEMMEEDATQSVMDAALIACAQRVEHYEIAAYGCVRTYARILGMNDAEQLLQQTLDEEAEADEKLTALADGIVNEEAAEGEEEMAGAGRSRSR